MSRQTLNTYLSEFLDKKNKVIFIVSLIALIITWLIFFIRKQEIVFGIVYPAIYAVVGLGMIFLNRKTIITKDKLKKEIENKISVYKKPLMIRFVHECLPSDIGNSFKQFIKESEFWDWSFYYHDIGDEHPFDLKNINEAKMLYCHPGTTDTSSIYVLKPRNSVKKHVSRIFLGYLDVKKSNVIKYTGFEDLKEVILANAHFTTYYEYRYSNDRKYKNFRTIKDDEKLIREILKDQIEIFDSKFPITKLEIIEPKKIDTSEIELLWQIK